MSAMELPKDMVEEAVRQSGDAVELNTSYSGRFMLGARCLGVIGTLAGYTRFMLALSWVAEDEDGSTWPVNENDIMGMAADVRMDNLGLDHVFYFPEVTITE